MAGYQKEKELQIIDGPCKMDLHTAHAYAYDKDHPFRVSFVDSDKRVYATQIVSLSHEDGSGHSYNITGIANGPSPINPAYSGAFNIEGYYNAKSRKGILTITYYVADNKR